MTAILFDLDGTLLDTLDDLADAVNMTLEHFGCPLRTKEEVRQFVGNGAERLIRLALPGKPDDPDVSQVLAYFKTWYAAHSQVKTCPYMGIPEALAEVKRECPVAIVSNKPDNAVKILCRQYFDGVFALGESSRCPRKPAPDMVRLAMEAIGADRCIYVGDSEVDVLTAKNAGVPCLSVLWGFRDKDTLLAAGGEHFCETPAELLNALKEMM
jgi:phosphoglycolate phosphatase